MAPINQRRWPTVQRRPLAVSFARSALFLGLAGLLLGSHLPAQDPVRTELFFPNLPGLTTLRCDFHLHTVFSDGSVWPTVRVEEAWRHGLDAIALTDHIEYLPHKNDLPNKFGRPHEIAQETARSLGILLIRSAEITRGEPPGHLNALFLTNVAALDQKDYRVAISNAFLQGAFLFWNHPGWQQPGRKAVWYAEQGEFLSRGWLRGIEIVNGRDYESIPHQWSIDKQLTILGNSDAHAPIGFDYSMEPGGLRPMTLVFATERSVEAIREALFARRTAVLSRNQLLGEAQYLQPLFAGSIEVVNPQLRFAGKGRLQVQVRNKAPLSFELVFPTKLPDLALPESVVLAAGKITAFTVRCTSDQRSGEESLQLPCRVANLLVAPDTGLSTTLPLNVAFGGKK